MYKYITNSHLATRVVYAALSFLYLAGQSRPFCYGPCRAFEKTVSERERENETDSCLWLVETTRVLFLQLESWLHTNHTPFHSTKPVIQANKKPCIYWNTWSTSTLPSDEENNHFTFATQKKINCRDMLFMWTLCS